MQEDQNIEWKAKWKDEYLKEICGFANAQGGRLYIGKDDSGKVLGLADSRKLLVDLPNKVQQVLGIVVEVNLRGAPGTEFIEVNVAPNSIPINYKGEYYYRSGSTNRRLTGSALNRFILEHTDLTWDSLPCPGVRIEELDQDSFDIFRREAVRSGRLDERDVRMSNSDLLQHLDMFSKDGVLKRAAVMLFYRRQTRFFSGCYVRIAKFGKGSEILYQDEVYGSLLFLADRVVDLIYLKYLTASISYDGDLRIETYPYPRPAVRELVYNALIHCNWAANIPIHIRVGDEGLSVTNCCILPMGWTEKDVLALHRSHPYNPEIARVFFRAGYVETWGRGLEKVKEACLQSGSPMPKCSLLGEDLTLLLPVRQEVGAPAETVMRDTQGRGVTRAEKRAKLYAEIIRLLGNNGQLSQQSLAQILGISVRTLKRCMDALQQDGVIKRYGNSKNGGWIVCGYLH